VRLSTSSRGGTSADTNAAESLEGLTLDTGWVVIAKVENPPGATSGFFSVGYRVKKDGEECFLKAFNFARISTCPRPRSYCAH
jgi:hypothetical protein